MRELRASGTQKSLALDHQGQCGGGIDLAQNGGSRRLPDTIAQSSQSSLKHGQQPLECRFFLIHGPVVRVGHSARLTQTRSQIYWRCENEGTQSDKMSLEQGERTQRCRTIVEGKVCANASDVRVHHARQPPMDAWARHQGRQHALGTLPVGVISGNAEPGVKVAREVEQPIGLQTKVDAVKAPSRSG